MPFHMMHIPPILRLEPKEYFYSNLSDATVYNYSKEAVMSVLDALRQRSVIRATNAVLFFIRNFDDIFINNFMF